MHSHLDIQVNGKSLAIQDDAQLSVEEKNPMFNDVTFFSYPMQIPVDGNREVLKNIAHRDSDMRAMDLEYADARIFADGLPLNHGQVITQDGSEINDKFEFNIDAQQQSFSELIGDLECRDVAVKDRLLIGKQLGKIEGTYGIAAYNKAMCYNEDGDMVAMGVVGDERIAQYTGVHEDPQYGYHSPKQELDTSGEISVENPQALGFSTPLNINVSQPYPFPYCNARVAYAVAQEDEDNAAARNAAEHGNEGYQVGPYWVLDANRPQSGVCFYVLYFLDCLFAQLGVIFDNSELLAFEDFKRLTFFTTKCGYDLEETDTTLNSLSEINNWLSTNKCGGQIKVSVNSGDSRMWLSAEGHVTEYVEYAEGMVVNFPYRYYNKYYKDLGFWLLSMSTKVCNMYANSDNFPSGSVSSVISSLENSFGIRFLYDPEKRLVTARLLRNVYRHNQVRQFNGKILSMIPVTEKITGVRMAYSAESERKEQKNNVRYGIRDYDTEFDYIEYPEDRTILNLHYGDIAKKVSATDMNVYVDLATGNSYRVKIDSDAEDPSAYRPVLFQVAQYKGVESGDCSERHADYVKEFISEFRPLTSNVINASEYTADKTGEVSPILAPLLNVEMETPYTDKTINSVFFADESVRSWFVRADPDGRHTGVKSGPWSNGLSVSLTLVLNLAESYDPTQTDSGNSPLQDIDWGLTVGVMRGAGSGSELIEYDRGYDGFDNSRWKDTIAIYELTSDTMDLKGAIFDYNGAEAGDGGGERFALSIRSWAQFVYYTDSNNKLHINKDVSLAGQPVEGVSGKTWLIPCDDDERDLQGNVVNKIRSRGLLDTFMREHTRFLLERKPYKVKTLATIAQLLDIRNHWSDWYVIDGKVGLVNAIRYNISKATGVGEAELEFYSY